MRMLLCVCATCGVIESNAYAGFSLSTISTQTTVGPSSIFRIDVQVDRSDSSVCNSAIYRVAFSIPGIRLTNYEWFSPFESGSIYDDTSPHLSQLPAVITADLVGGLGWPSDAADIELSNVADTPFESGVLTSLFFQVPGDFEYRGPLELQVVPDTFANGFQVIPTVAGAPLVIEVIPSPSAAAIFCVAGMRMCRRRRKQSK